MLSKIILHTFLYSTESIGMLKEFQSSLEELLDSTITDSAQYMIKLAQARQDNYQVPNDEVFVQNEKRMNEILLNYLEGGIEKIDSPQRAWVSDLAMRCVFEAGEGVYIARALYNTFFDEPIQVDDILVCQQLGYFKTAPTFAEEIIPPLNENKPKVGLLVFPNPSRELFNFNFIGEIEKENYLIKIYDLFGQEIISNTISSNLTTLDLSKFSGGLYQYIISKEGELLFNGKLSLVK